MTPASSSSGTRGRAATPRARSQTFRGYTGLELHGDRHGDGAPVLLLHGGGQTRHAWLATAQRLAAQGWSAFSVDQRGHGDSGWDPEGAYRVEDFGRDVVSLCAAVGEPPVLVGASLGGLAAMLAVGEFGADARALVLVDIAVRPEPAGVDRILEFMGRHARGGFASLDEAADAVAAYLPHRRRPPAGGGLLRNLREGVDGRYYWHWDPAFLDAAHAQPPEHWEPLLRRAAGALSLPVLLVRGGSSDVLSAEGVEDFLTLVPHAEFAEVGDAAHMVVGDRNDAFATAVLDFLERR